MDISLSLILLQVSDASDLYVTEMKLYKNAINQSEVRYIITDLVIQLESTGDSA